MVKSTIAGMLIWGSLTILIGDCAFLIRHLGWGASLVVAATVMLAIGCAVSIHSDA